MEVKEYVEKFLEAYKLLKKKKMRPTDAEEIAIEIMKEHAKDRRAKNISRNYDYKVKEGETTAQQSKDELATQKQKDFMEELNIDYEDDITKTEASKKIDEKLNEEKES